MFLTDFHIHSTFSDGKLAIPQIVDLYGERGFGAIAITDHLCEETGLPGRAAHYLEKTLTRGSFPLYTALLRTEAERAWKKYRMLVIPGIEITKNSLLNRQSEHILALGVNEWISADQPVERIAAQIRNLKGLSVVAHPLTPTGRKNEAARLWDRRDELSKIVDAWETTYHHLLLHDVLDSKLPRLATSDFHHRRHLNSWKTEFDCRLEQNEIFEAIRAGNVSVQLYKEGEESDCLFDLRHLGAGLWREPVGHLAGASR